MKRQSDMRLCLAQAAARFMVEMRLTDFAAAKKKAAKSLGIQDLRLFPSDDEVVAALTQEDACLPQARALLETALFFMCKFSDFSPRLAGPLAQGCALPFLAIQIHLFADSEKEVELMLLASQKPYATFERKRNLGGVWSRVSVLTLREQDFFVELWVFPHRPTKAGETILKTAEVQKRLLALHPPEKEHRTTAGDEKA